MAIIYESSAVQKNTLESYYLQKIFMSSVFQVANFGRKMIGEVIEVVCDG